MSVVSQTRAHDLSVAFIRRVQKFIKDEIDTQPVIRVPVFVLELSAQLQKEDPEGFRLFAFAEANKVLEAYVRKGIRQTRGSILSHDRETLISRKNIGRNLASRLAKWKEHQGDHHMNLMLMTAQDLRSAARARRASAGTSLFIADLMDTLATSLEEGVAGERVTDRFTPEDVAKVACDLGASLGQDLGSILDEELGAEIES